MNSHVISFAKSAVELNYTEGRAAWIIDYLFRRLDHSNEVLPHLSLSLSENISGQLTLTEGSTITLATKSVSRMAEWVVSRVGYHLADKVRGEPCFMLQL